MFKTRGLNGKIILGLLGIALAVSQAHAFPMASKRFQVNVGGRSYLFPYESSHNLNQTDLTVEHVILSIHCSGFNALRAYRNAEIGIEQAGAPKDKYLILAPHFLTPDIVEQYIDHPDTRNLLEWKFNPFWGDSNGIYNGEKATVSSFDAIDQLLTNVITGGHFPNVHDIVIMGLSAGGQMVNRYAAVNRFEFEIAAPRAVTMRYLVMAPSTYVYLSGQRLKDGSLYTPGWLSPWDYNTWGYGLANMYEYHRRHKLTAEWIRSHYAKRQILYLVGGKDTDFSDKMLAKDASAMLQGKNRLERGYIYMAYLTKLFGKIVTQTQHFYEIPGVAHSDRPLIASPQGLAFIFKSDPGRQIARTDDTTSETEPATSR